MVIYIFTTYCFCINGRKVKDNNKQTLCQPNTHICWPDTACRPRVWSSFVFTMARNSSHCKEGTLEALLLPAASLSPSYSHFSLARTVLSKSLLVGSQCSYPQTFFQWILRSTFYIPNALLLLSNWVLFISEILWVIFSSLGWQLGSWEPHSWPPFNLSSKCQHYFTHVQPTYLFSDCLKNF